ncbi:MAG TPA: phosphoribosylanthranilate isomerase [Fimbriimonadaceae bacterium]|nr:phosphoribosylanthranilate isomerase [Fimbriimonadaceae bacterium]
MRTRIKVCCIAGTDEAELALSRGADVLGLVSAMPSGPGPIPDSVIADILGHVDRSVDTFLLTALQSAVAIAELHRRCPSTGLQLVDAVAPRELVQLRELLPETQLIQVVHVLGPEAVDHAVACAPFVDAVLLDSGNPLLAVKELGGTGRTHDWEVSRRIRESIDRPLFLAGGLNPKNVREAIDLVRPYGVDVCSGVRSTGRLDLHLLDAFVSAVRA